MRITTWNVNSLRIRLGAVLDFLASQQPDILALQEIKCLDEQVPTMELQAAGYHIATYGQRAYNGVALLTRQPMADIATGVPWPGDAPARGISAVAAGVRVVGLYVPNGKDVGTESYAYKLAWLGRLEEYLLASGAVDGDTVVCGDFNVAPADADVYDPVAWHERILCSTPERQAFEALLALGFQDALRMVNPEPQTYTWWDYQQGMFRRNRGLRIDHLLVSASLAPRVTAVEIHKDVRGATNPSDHAPVSLVLS